MPRSNTSVKDSQLDIAAFNPTISHHIMCAVKICMQEYLEWYPFLKNFDYHSTTCLLQKTKPHSPERKARLIHLWVDRSAVSGFKKPKTVSFFLIAHCFNIKIRN